MRTNRLMRLARVLAVVVVIMILPFSAHAAPGDIVTIAGDGVQRYAGDDGPATAASLGGPTDVAVNASGDVYIADFAGQRIRKISAADSTISTIAGNGTAGYSGDGGQATAAEISFPFGIAVDAQNNVYFSDYGNHRIRRVNASDGTISTIAGSGSNIYSGDGGSATAAGIVSPCGIALDDAGNLYIAESVFQGYGGGRIRKVSIADGTISTVAGGASLIYSGDGGPATAAGLFYPTGVSLDTSGNLYIVDKSSRIRKVNAADGIITTVAGNGVPTYSGDGGPATEASINAPYFASVDAAGNIYISDFGNHRVRKVNATDGIVTTVAGNGTAGYSGDNGPPTAARLNYPHSVIIDAAGNMYIADVWNYRVRKVIETIKPVGALTIYNKSGYANSFDSTLNLSCTDQGGSCVEMQFSNDGATYSTPQPYGSTAAWTLEPVAGTGTVYAMYKDAAGNWSDPVQSSYVMDSTLPAVSASPAGGIYAASQIVTLTCDDGAGSGCESIHYTTDNSMPTTASTIYAGPITVDKSMIVTFFGVDRAGNASGAASAAYVISSSFTVTPASGLNGSITPSSPITVNAGSTTIFVVQPDNGYRIASVIGCGGLLSGNNYITGAIAADCTVTATFEKNGKDHKKHKDKHHHDHKKRHKDHEDDDRDDDHDEHKQETKRRE